MTTTSKPRILVVGGGIAGNTVALQLLRAGIATTVVERATAPRPGGQAVDLRTASREAAERMGLLPGIRKLQIDERGWAYVDESGKVYARIDVAMFDGEGPAAEIEIARGDLNQVLLDHIAETGGPLDYRYGDWIEHIAQDDTGADVTFASGGTERFDLVIAADGVHSATRRLVFGPEEQFTTHLGGYMAFFTLPTPADAEEGWLTGCSIPSASFAIRPDRDPVTSKAIITLRQDYDPALRRDPAAQQARIREMLTGAGWKASTILDAMASTPDFYFDQLARVDVPELSSGRVTLLGDAGYCGSPLTGMGTAMAIVGAYILAGEIAATPGDLGRAQARYQELITPFLDKAKELPGGGIKMMLPTSKFGTAMARMNWRLMTSKPMRPVARKLFSPATADYVLPTY
ncbi:FAD-dependent monooxygenase [Nocardia concava]|uniref:FAD-dependent monooxygenase n=1 Tax=Nocardia concava TaxID=257281 RepID=UPI00031B8896|nr:FAD-dependent monooxygenase [Nocardia concava]